MAQWNYRHRIEYHRVLPDRTRVHEHTELVEDAGFCMKRKGFTRTQWAARYARWCAEDFLERVHAKAGEFIVAVYQQRPDNDTRDVCSVQLRWTPEATDAVSPGQKSRTPGGTADGRVNSPGRR